ncbi:MAG TPA: DUF6134 family protein [Bacteroidia bacterium]|nr:DUF6134 family protein [Bacteroidia bacterium]
MSFRPRFFFFLLLLTWNARIQAQTSRLFDIEIAKIKVGNLIVEKVAKDSLSIYIFKSEVDAWLLVRIRVSHLITCVYRNDKLLKANIHSVINNKTYVSTVEWKKDHYDYDCSTYKYHKAGSTTENIDFSVVKMYFAEPLGKKQIFAENYGLFAPLQYLPHSEYRIDVEKNRNTFQYLNGTLQKVEMETPLFNYTIRRKS